VDEPKTEAGWTVLTYSGYKGDETPRSLASGDLVVEIEEILSRRRVIDSESGKQYEKFECRAGGRIVLIKIYSTGEKTLSFPNV